VLQSTRSCVAFTAADYTPLGEIFALLSSAQSPTSRHGVLVARLTADLVARCMFKVLVAGDSCSSVHYKRRHVTRLDRVL